MNVEFDGNVAFLSFKYDEKRVKLCRVLGGEYDRDSRRWVIAEPIFCYLIKRCCETAKTENRDLYDVLYESANLIIHESETSQDTPLHVECPTGLNPTHPQYSAIKWILRRPAVLEADPMGAGKTIMCALSAQMMKAKRVLIICMASVKANWRMEWKRWNLMAKNGESTVACAQSSFWPGTDVVIVNFDILERFRTRYTFEKDENGNVKKPLKLVIEQNGQIDSVDWDLVIIDECHKIKGRSAIRTQAVIGEKYHKHVLCTPIKAKKRIALSGTPMPNRPIEAWPVLFWLWPNSFPDQHAYGVRYCDGKRGKWGWTFTGHSNESELNARLRLLGMISRPKSITHAGIPNKVRRIVEFEAGSSDEKLILNEKLVNDEIAAANSELVVKANAAIVFEDESAWRDAMKELRQKVVVSIGLLTKARLDLARSTLPRMIQYAKEKVEERGKVVMFTWHQEIADKIAEAFGSASVKITGSVDTVERKPLMDRFQTDPSCKVIVGTIGAMGTGVTLTAAKLTLFFELGWVPGEILQAEDRIYRIGQTEQTEIQYLVVEGSLSAVMAERVIEKLDVIERCVGPVKKNLEALPITASTIEAPCAGTPYEELQRLAGLLDSMAPQTEKDKLLALARGTVRTRVTMHMLDQFAAGRLATIEPWSGIQRALAHKIIERYWSEQ